MLHPNGVIDALLFILILIPSVMLHEVAHGALAFRLGDHTARDAGRLSLNPVRHVDPFGSVLLPGMLALAGQNVFGWAKPVPVNPSRFRRPVEGMAVTALAGPLTNLAVAFVVGSLGPFREQAGVIVVDRDTLLIRILFGIVVVNAALAVFNMLPIPPLDGSRLLPLVLPPAGRRVYAQVSPYGFLILIALIFVFDGALAFLGGWIRWIVRLVI